MVSKQIHTLPHTLTHTLTHSFTNQFYFPILRIDVGSDRIAAHNLHTCPNSSDPREQERWQAAHGKIFLEQIPSEYTIYITTYILTSRYLYPLFY